MQQIPVINKFMKINNALSGFNFLFLSGLLILSIKSDYDKKIVNIIFIPITIIIEVTFYARILYNITKNNFNIYQFYYIFPKYTFYHNLILLLMFVCYAVQPIISNNKNDLTFPLILLYIFIKLHVIAFYFYYYAQIMHEIFVIQNNLNNNVNNNLNNNVNIIINLPNAININDDEKICFMCCETINVDNTYECIRCKKPLHKDCVHKLVRHQY